MGTTRRKTAVVLFAWAVAVAVHAAAAADVCLAPAASGGGGPTYVLDAFCGAHLPSTGSADAPMAAVASAELGDAWADVEHMVRLSDTDVLVSGLAFTASESASGGSLDPFATTPTLATAVCSVANQWSCSVPTPATLPAHLPYHWSSALLIAPTPELATALFAYTYSSAAGNATLVVDGFYVAAPPAAAAPIITPGPAGTHVFAELPGAGAAPLLALVGGSSTGTTTVVVTLHEGPLLVGTTLEGAPSTLAIAASAPLGLFSLPATNNTSAAASSHVRTLALPSAVIVGPLVSPDTGALVFVVATHNWTLTATVPAPPSALLAATPLTPTLALVVTPTAAFVLSAAGTLTPVTSSLPLLAATAPLLLDVALFPPLATAPSSPRVTAAVIYRTNASFSIFSAIVAIDTGALPPTAARVGSPRQVALAGTHNTHVRAVALAPHLALVRAHNTLGSVQYAHAILTLGGEQHPTMAVGDRLVLPLSLASAAPGFDPAELELCLVSQHPGATLDGDALALVYEPPLVASAAARNVTLVLAYGPPTETREIVVAVAPRITPPHNLTVLLRFTTGVLTWEAAVVGDGGTPANLEYDVYINGVLAATTTDLALDLDNLVPGTAYTFEATARWNGVVSPHSLPVTATTDIVCEPGSAPHANASICVGCARGTFSGGGLGPCTACPPGKDAPPLSTSVASCVCAPGYAGATCAPCPSGASCSGGASAPVAAPGYVAVGTGASAVFVRCHVPAACPGHNSTTPCGPGYTGRLCGACSSGYRSFQGVCTPCSDRNGWSAGVFLAAVVLACVALYFSTRSVPQFAVALDITVGALQHLALFAATVIPANNADIRALSLFALFRLELPVVDSECGLDITGDSAYFANWLIAITSPLWFALATAVATALGVVWVAVWIPSGGARLAATHPLWATSTVVGRALTQASKGPSDLVRASVRVWYGLLEFSFLPVAVRLLEFTVCTRAFPSSPVRSISGHPGAVCYNAEWWSYFPIALAAALIIVIGMPLSAAVALARPRTWPALHLQIVSRHVAPHSWYVLVFYASHLGHATLHATLHSGAPLATALLLLGAASVALLGFVSPYASSFFTAYDMTATITALFGILFLAVGPTGPRAALLLVLAAAMLLASLAASFIEGARLWLSQSTAATALLARYNGTRTTHGGELENMAEWSSCDGYESDASEYDDAGSAGDILDEPASAGSVPRIAGRVLHRRIAPVIARWASPACAEPPAALVGRRCPSTGAIVTVVELSDAFAADLHRIAGIPAHVATVFAREFAVASGIAEPAVPMAEGEARPIPATAALDAAVFAAAVAPSPLLFDFLVDLAAESAAASSARAGAGTAAASHSSSSDSAQSAADNDAGASGGPQPAGVSLVVFCLFAGAWSLRCPRALRASFVYFLLRYLGGGGGGRDATQVADAARELLDVTPIGSRHARFSRTTNRRYLVKRTVKTFLARTGERELTWEAYAQFVSKWAGETQTQLGLVLGDGWGGRAAWREVFRLQTHASVAVQFSDDDPLIVAVTAAATAVGYARGPQLRALCESLWSVHGLGSVGDVRQLPYHVWEQLPTILPLPLAVVARLEALDVAPHAASSTTSLPLVAAAVVWAYTTYQRLATQPASVLWSLVVLFTLVFEINHSVLAGLTDPAYSLLGGWLVVSKACGGAIRALLFFIFLPLLDAPLTAAAQLLTRLHARGTLVRALIPSRRHLTVFHRVAGTAVWFFGAVHAFAHLVSATRVGAATDAERAAAFPSSSRLSAYASADSATKVVMATWLGFSGLLLLLLFSLVALFSLPLVRRVWFELFYTTHHLVFVATILVAFHPTTSRTAWFAGLGLGAYLIHRAVSLLTSLPAHPITHAAPSVGRVAVVKFRPTRAMRRRLAPGTFVWLNVPWLSSTQWHPFSVASSPLADDVSLYIKAVGAAESWTSALVDAVAADASAVVGRRIRVAGPFRTDSRNVGAFAHSILIASGIGVTPYASIISDLLYRHQRGELERTHTISFWWVTRSLDGYDWFLTLLAHLAAEANTAVAPSPHRLVTDIRIFVSGATAPSSRNIPAALAPHAVVAPGRPQLPYMLGYAAAHHTHTTPLGIFFCGISSLADEVRAAARSLPRVEYHEENFTQ